jgi:hypothetical protein
LAAGIAGHRENSGKNKEPEKSPALHTWITRLESGFRTIMLKSSDEIAIRFK